MVLYRRQRLPGGTYFFTLTLHDRSQQLLTEHIESLRLAYGSVQKRQASPVPNGCHRHTPGPSALFVDVARRRYRLFDALETDQDPIHRRARRFRRRNERAVWQPRFWEHAIRDETDLSRHIDYIHFNPAKHGLVDRVADWPHSSFHRFCRDGILPKDWAGGFESRRKKGE